MKPGAANDVCTLNTYLYVRIVSLTVFSFWLHGFLSQSIVVYIFNWSLYMSLKQHILFSSLIFFCFQGMTYLLLLKPPLDAMKSTKYYRGFMMSYVN